MSDAATIRLRPEEPGDAAAIRQIHRLAFEGEVEAEIVDAIRAAEAAVLSLVAEEAAGGGAAAPPGAPPRSAQMAARRARAPARPAASWWDTCCSPT